MHISAESLGLTRKPLITSLLSSDNPTNTTTGKASNAEIPVVITSAAATALRKHIDATPTDEGLFEQTEVMVLAPVLLVAAVIAAHRKRAKF